MLRRVVTDRDARAFAAQLLDQRRALHVGTGHALAAREQNARDRAHADPADADEMVRTLLHAAHSPISRSERSNPGENRRNGVDGFRVAAPPPAMRRDAAEPRCPQEQAAQPPGVEFAVRNHDCRAGGAQFFGVRRLMVLRRERIRHQNRRPPGRREFAERRCAGARQHQIGRGVRVREIVQVRPDAPSGCPMAVRTRSYSFSPVTWISCQPSGSPSLFTSAASASLIDRAP